MDDGVPGVEEHPVAKRRPLDFRRRIAGVATGLDDPVGDRADMNVRAARGNYHPVSERGFARQLDRNNVFGLGVLETVDDDLREEVDCRVANDRIAASRRNGRVGMRREYQCRVPLGAEAIRLRPARKMWRPRALFKPVRACSHYIRRRRRDTRGQIGRVTVAGPIPRRLFELVLGLVHLRQRRSAHHGRRASRRGRIAAGAYPGRGFLRRRSILVGVRRLLHRTFEVGR